MSAFHLRKRNLTRYLPQSNRILNLGTAFTFLTAFQLYAGTSYSQTTTLSLSLKNATLEQAIDRIEEETGYSFLLIGFIVVVLELKRILEIEVNISFYTSGIHVVGKTDRCVCIVFQTYQKNLV